MAPPQTARVRKRFATPIDEAISSGLVRFARPLGPFCFCVYGWDVRRSRGLGPTERPAKRQRPLRSEAGVKRPYVGWKCANVSATFSDVSAWAPIKLAAKRENLSGIAELREQVASAHPYRDDNATIRRSRIDQDGAETSTAARRSTSLTGVERQGVRNFNLNWRRFAPQRRQRRRPLNPLGRRSADQTLRFRKLWHVWLRLGVWHGSVSKLGAWRVRVLETRVCCRVSMSAIRVVPSSACSVEYGLARVLLRGR